jgi:hypothetical protein
VKVDFGPGVSEADWQALVSGYRASPDNLEAFPEDCGFAMTVDRKYDEPLEEGVPSERHNLVRAVFEDDRFWMVDNFRGGRDQFLLISHKRCARVHCDGGGKLFGSVGGTEDRNGVIWEAQEVLRLYRSIVDPKYLLPLDRIGTAEGAVRIERLERPAPESHGRWNVVLTRPNTEDGTQSRFKAELDPASGWAITKYGLHETGMRMDLESEYERVGGVLMPVKNTYRHKTSKGNSNSRLRLRILDEQEQAALKQEVEKAADSVEKTPYAWLRRLIVSLAVASPAVGMILLWLSPRAVEAKTQEVA